MTDNQADDAIILCLRRRAIELYALERAELEKQITAAKGDREKTLALELELYQATKRYVLELHQNDKRLDELTARSRTSPPGDD